MSTETTTVTIGGPATDVATETTVVTITASTGPRGLSGDVASGAAEHPDLATHNTLGLATQDELDAEAVTRAAADTALSDLLTTEQTTRANADTALDGRLDTIEGDYTTSAEVTAAINAVLDGAPGALDTLNELAAAIGDDANYAATVTAALATKAAAADLTSHLADTTTHGTTGAIVGTTDTQTLTGKTLNDFSNYVEADALHIRVRNVSGATIAKGVPVFITGYNAGQELVTVGPADASSAATMPALGITSEAIANNTTGAIEARGLLQGLNTSGFSVGDELYVSETTGALTATAPATPALVQKVGTVVRSHATLGVLDVATEPTATAYASDTVHGIVELATSAETVTGTDTTRATTPAGVKAAVDNAASDYATAAQGATADTAVQPAAIADMVESTDIDTIEVVTQAAYDLLSPPAATTAYFIVG